jgi:hypothetical protein
VEFEGAQLANKIMHAIAMKPTWLTFIL